MNQLILDGQWITIQEVIDVARHHFTLTLGANAKANIIKASERVAAYVKDETIIYGITTGFGKFSDQYIKQEDTAKLQVNLIRSHACGVGDPYSEEVVRAMMLLRINSLVQGHSGITLTTLQVLLDMLNKNIIPVVPSQGSLGASGDLAPLSHIALAMMGEGEVFLEHMRVPASQAMAKHQIAPAILQAKEGLALINGTQALCATGLITLYDAMKLADMADITLAMTLSALQGIRCAFDERIALVRPYPGHHTSSKHVRSLLKDNSFVGRQNDLRVQDAYSLRCASQVHGASRDAFAHIAQQVEIEINSVTDNPILFDHDVISGGNFHGQPMALVFDYLAIAISELANISERRLERLVNPALSNGLPAFLTRHGGLHSGFMIVQYSAAALVSENKVYAHPASVDSIPSSANQEDHVSMGNFAARKAAVILKNARQVVQMELFAAAQGVDLRCIDNSCHLGEALSSVHESIRREVAFVDEDIVMYEAINKMNQVYDNIVRQLEEGRLCL